MSKNQIVIRVTRPCGRERFLSMKEFDYRKKWYKIDDQRWTNRGLEIGEIS